jgi:(p)ppGpp synthase/HD superfamily hydrolase
MAVKNLKRAIYKILNYKTPGVEQIELAKTIATRAHEGQEYGRAVKEPYIIHPAGVADIVWRNGGSWIAVAAAWLHDVLEDTVLIARDLSELGVDPRVVLVVVMLTRAKDETYEHYIDFIATHGSVDTLRVKLADLEFNLSRKPRGNQKRKYQRAHAILSAALKPHQA